MKLFELHHEQGQIKVIISVPHAAAGKGDDNSSAIVAKHLEFAMNSQKVPCVTRYGQKPREERDLNRKGSDDTDWREDLRKLMEPGDIVLDIHSYGMGEGDETWSHADCVIFIVPDVTNDILVDYLIRSLHSAGVNAITETGTEVNDIVMDAMEENSNGILIEYNDQKLQKLQTFAHAVAQVMAWAVSNMPDTGQAPECPSRGGVDVNNGA